MWIRLQQQIRGHSMRGYSEECLEDCNQSYVSCKLVCRFGFHMWHSKKMRWLNRILQVITRIIVFMSFHVLLLKIREFAWFHLLPNDFADNHKVWISIACIWFTRILQQEAKERWFPYLESEIFLSKYWSQYLTRNQWKTISKSICNDSMTHQFNYHVKSWKYNSGSKSKSKERCKCPRRNILQ